MENMIIVFSVGDVLYSSNGEWIIDNYSGILTFYTLPTVFLVYYLRQHFIDI